MILRAASSLEHSYMYLINVVRSKEHFGGKCGWRSDGSHFQCNNFAGFYNGKIQVAIGMAMVFGRMLSRTGTRKEIKRLIRPRTSSSSSRSTLGSSPGATEQVTAKKRD